MSAQKLNLSDLKSKSPKDLLSMAEELEIENRESTHVRRFTSRDINRRRPSKGPGARHR